MIVSKLALFLISNFGHQMDDAQDEMQLNLQMSTTTTAGKSKSGTNAQKKCIQPFVSERFKHEVIPPRLDQEVFFWGGGGG